ncbi:hypothetical protein O6H91_07G022700 [Diphasiastrum complanatum]|uniref:Uncharacterized protein n=1 Tax=Diphasiastrum complanatum TaxID=34168 RepID=A0ACC2D3J1_DIPCM|nr:hypothetical protein O6H91_07G022700 [Diphasiastrum complanatum]
MPDPVSRAAAINKHNLDNCTLQEMVPEDGYLPRYTSSKSLAKLLMSSFLNVSREMAADSICDVIARLFCSDERKDFELQNLSQQLSEERSQTQKLQSCIEESNRNADERLRKCHTDLQENSNKIRGLEEKYVCSQNSLKKCREKMQVLKEQAEVEREAGIENLRARDILIRDKAE